MIDRNRKRALQELTENHLREEKEYEQAYSLKLHNSEGYETVIHLKKKTATEFPPFKFKYYSLHTHKKKEEINFYDYYGHLEKFGFEWKIVVFTMGVCETLEFKYTVEFSSHKKKLIKKIIISKGTRNSFFIDESRIWNFSTETIDAANTRSYLLNYMTNEHLTKEFW